MRVVVRAQVPIVIRSELDPRPELGSHMTEEDIARIASVYNPDNPQMMKKLAGEMRAAKEQEIGREKDLLEGFKRELGLSEPVIETAGSIYETTLARARRLETRARTAPIAAYAVVMALRQHHVPVRTLAVVNASKAINPRQPVRLHDIMRLEQLLPYHVQSMSAKGWQAAGVKKLEHQGVVSLSDVPGILERAAKILDCLPEGIKAGHTPAVLAAATLYLGISPERRYSGSAEATQNDVAEAVGAAEYSVREFVPEIRNTGCA